MEKNIKRERNSATKNEIISFLEHSKIALAHKDFQEYFKEKLDKVTIYRALDRLVLEGKLHKIVNLDGVIQYAICKECTHENHNHSNETNKGHENHHHEHVHFSCTNCKQTTCLENYIPKINIPKEYKIHETQILINGICKNCNV